MWGETISNRKSNEKQVETLPLIKKEHALLCITGHSGVAQGSGGKFKILTNQWIDTLTLETFVWILNCALKPITWSLFNNKASNLDKWPISMLSFKWWCQFVDNLKFEICPSTLLPKLWNRQFRQLTFVLLWWSDNSKPHCCVPVLMHILGYNFIGWYYRGHS